MADLRGFLFDVERWFGSVAAQRMTFAEKGVYLSMLFQQWRAKEHNLPDDPRGVADLIAVTAEQVTEVEAAWEVVRLKFVTSRHSTNRIYNVEIENTRRRQRAYRLARASAGERGGKAKARKAQGGKVFGASIAIANPSNALAKSSNALAKPSDQIRSDQSREEKKEREIARARTVLDGSLPRDHRGHAFCDDNFAICVPSQVHSKLIGPMSRREGGDREKAHTALLAWYAQEARALPSDFVMGDAFRFWQARFDAAFASPIPSERADALEVQTARVRELLQKGAI